MDDDEVVRVLRDELRLTMGITADPTEVAVHRWPRSFPQYAPGHLDRVREATASLPEGLAVAGAALGGIGLPGPTRCRRAAAKRARRDEPVDTR